MTIRQAQDRAARPTRAQLRREGRLAERRDVIEQMRACMAGAQAIAAKHARAGVAEDIDITLYVARIDALIGTLESGCHEGLGGGAMSQPRAYAGPYPILSHRSCAEVFGADIEGRADEGAGR